MQTTGATIDEAYLRFLRNHVGVVTISLSVSCLVDDATNRDVIDTKDADLCLERLCSLIKKYDINLRLSLNVTDRLMMTKAPDKDRIFDRCSELKADQVTFRKMYVSGENEQSRWLASHRIDDEEGWFGKLIDTIRRDGRFLEILEYGARRYSYRGMSIVVDDDCMFYIRLDKQKAVLGTYEVAHHGDVIAVTGKIQSHPARKEVAARTLSEFLAGLGQSEPSSD